MFLGGLHGSTLRAVVLVDGLQACRPAVPGPATAGRTGHRLIGQQHGFAAAQAVECLHVQADGVGGGAVQRHGRCGVRGCGLNGQRGGGSRAGGQRHGGSTRKRLGAGHGVRNGVHGSVLLFET